MSKIMAMAGSSLTWTCECGWSFVYTAKESGVFDSNEFPAEFEMHVLVEGHYTRSDV